MRPQSARRSPRTEVQKAYPDGSDGLVPPSTESPRNWSMFCAHVDQHMSYTDIAKQHQVTIERVRQIVYHIDRGIPYRPDGWTGLSPRTVNALRAFGIEHPRETMTMTDDELLGVLHFGPSSLREVRAAFPQPESHKCE